MGKRSPGYRSGPRRPKERKTNAMSPVAIEQSQMQREGVTVVGEAMRRVAPESVEFLFEISAGASTAAQALRDNQAKNSQIAHALAALGVIPADLRTISVNVY